MLCETCLSLLTELSRLQQEKCNKGTLILRELIQTGTIDGSQEDVANCYICIEWRKTISLTPLPPLEDLEVPFEENPRLSLRDLQFEYQYDTYTSSKFVLQRQDGEIFDKAATCRLSASTGSEESLGLAASWFRFCQEHHGECNRQQDVGWYPRRLLDISDVTPRLVLTSEHTPSGPYATMSHCWGGERFEVLTAENEKDFIDAIPLESLLRNFRDVTTVVKRFGIRYIWIDCYCIIQDSKSGSHKTEKLLDIAQMRKVYANSVLNIGASNSTSPRDGCFSNRQTPAILSEFFSLADPTSDTVRANFHLYATEHVHYDVSRFGIHPLFDRAWVYQERILSRRMLHFGMGHLYWECPESGLVSETFPLGHSLEDYDEVLAYKIDFDAAKWNDQGLGAWAQTVEDYSRLQLSHPTEDKFVAIAGIAQLAAEAVDDRYVAGFLERHLIVQLGWRTFADIKTAETWRAPSWSWAAVEDDSLDIHGSLRNVEPRYIELAHVEEINIELLDPENPYGALKAGHLVLKGRPIRTKPLQGPIWAMLRHKCWWNFSLPGPPREHIYAEIFLDDPSHWPEWRTSRTPNMSAESTLQLRSLEPELYILPLCITFEPEQDDVSVQEILAKSHIDTRLLKMRGLLVQRLSSNDFVRRGAIDNLYAGEGNSFRVLLEKCDAMQDEMITLY